MKMEKSQYKKLKMIIETTLKRFPDRHADYTQAGLSEIRFAWDTFHYTMDTSLHSSNLENYFSLRAMQDRYDDVHIQTALLKIIKEFFKTLE